MHIFRAVLIGGIFCAISVNAQIFSAGVVGGAPFTDVVSAANQNNVAIVSQSSNFTAGPSVQIGLPLNLRVEVDALYRPYNFMVATALPSITNYNVSAMDWSFPFLLQYRFRTHLPLVRPFVEIGESFDHLGDLSAVAKNITSGPGTLIRQTNNGFVLGGGVDVKVPFIRFSGELRYIHQGAPDFQAISNVNQAEVLFGVRF